MSVCVTVSVCVCAERQRQEAEKRQRREVRELRILGSGLGFVSGFGYLASGVLLGFGLGFVLGFASQFRICIRFTH